MNGEINLNFHRLYGLGDATMLLAAAHALKLNGYYVKATTEEKYAEIIRACPHINRVVITTDQPNKLTSHLVGFDPYSYVFGVADDHQINQYLKHFGITAPTEHKTLEITVPEKSINKIESILAPFNNGKKRVLIHAAKGEINRNWGRENWGNLVNALNDQGYQIIRIGSGNGGKGVYYTGCSGMLDLVNDLSLLDLIALCRVSDFFISSDSGPIQLAGASSIGIIGLYTVAKGCNRLPYRVSGKSIAVDAPCIYAPCFPLNIHPTIEGKNRFCTWCPKGDYNCGITLDAVLKAFQTLSSEVSSVSL